MGKLEEAASEYAGMHDGEFTAWIKDGFKEGASCIVI